MARKQMVTRLPAPYLRRVSFLPEKAQGRSDYPFSLNWLARQEFEFDFIAPVTIFVGENGVGKSTLIEAIAALAGYDEAGGGKGYVAVDHSGAKDRSGAALAEALLGSWLPKVTNGWFFRAETFFSVARWLDTLEGAPPPDFLSHSHGEGFLRFFNERTQGQGLYILDEPEFALSPRRQLELLRHLAEVQHTARAQVIMATHAPVLMAVPGADLIEIDRGGPRRVSLEQVAHFRMLRAFCDDPEEFVRSTLDGDEELLF